MAMTPAMAAHMGGRFSLSATLPKRVTPLREPSLTILVISWSSARRARPTLLPFPVPVPVLRRTPPVRALSPTRDGAPVVARGAHGGAPVGVEPDTG